MWHEFRRAGWPQELTLVSLDLAEAYLTQGKCRHAVRLLTLYQGIFRRAWRRRVRFAPGV